MFKDFDPDAPPWDVTSSEPVVSPPKVEADNQDLFITLFCDASFCPKTKAGGFGGWVKFGFPPRTFRVGGVLDQCNNAEEAEICAVIYTLTHAQNSKWFNTDFNWEGKVLVIQSDCQGAIRKLKPVMGKNLKHLKLKYIKWKWVKGHSGYGNKRSAVNEFCDKQAKKYMYEERKRRRNRESSLEN